MLLTERRNSIGSRTLTWAFLLALLPLALGAAGPGTDDDSDLEGRDEPEYRVKALFLYKLAHWITWPKSNLPAKSKEITIGVVGKDPFGKNLELIEKLKPIKKRKVKVTRFARVADIRDCQIVFLSSKLSKADEKAVIRKAKSDGFVTISEVKGFADRGGMFNLVVVKNKIGFEANPGAAKSAKIAISTHLLKLAHRIVKK